MRVLGVITARGGSKGLPRKNIRSLGGKPLIVHTIKSALGLGDRLHRLVVSTDDEEIAVISRAASPTGWRAILLNRSRESQGSDGGSQARGVAVHVDEC